MQSQTNNKEIIKDNLKRLKILEIYEVLKESLMKGPKIGEPYYQIMVCLVDSTTGNIISMGTKLFNESGNNKNFHIKVFRDFYSHNILSFELSNQVRNMDPKIFNLLDYTFKYHLKYLSDKKNHGGT